MLDAPPTGRSRVPQRPSKRTSPILLGILVHGGCALAACFLGPAALGSNIWPIAGVMLSILFLPVAAGTGAWTGWILTRRDPTVVTRTLVTTGVGLGVAIVILMVILD